MNFWDTKIFWNFIINVLAVKFLLLKALGIKIIKFEVNMWDHPFSTVRLLLYISFFIILNSLPHPNEAGRREEIIFQSHLSL